MALSPWLVPALTATRRAGSIPSLQGWNVSYQWIKGSTVSTSILVGDRDRSCLAFLLSPSVKASFEAN